MDSTWFKKRLRASGKTAGDVALCAGKARSGFSQILSERQRMTLDWARAYAEVTQTPLSEVLFRAGQISAMGSGLGAPVDVPGDVAELSSAMNDKVAQSVRESFRNDGELALWVVQSSVMSLAGYLPNDRLLVDISKKELARAGDVIIARAFDHQTRIIKWVLRRYEPPVLVAASPAEEDRRVYVVDRTNVEIIGCVIASWRIR